ncbi:hypothetical protein TEA_022862 [Camellia sinensis var. sinensis]|uniref:Bifunctional inhibitor/plant lipid transfer protein/seed storage helical domain-containing protein n=1 Tax=Camellia sinensis var. sinensis TaxID=542762 RepID=A0A4S4E8Z9_CAMSN|nr:hypothetical protein TEA_022862 [Camellia sinensis var. sinensis]
MEAPKKYICVLGFLLFLGIAELGGVNGAGECGKASPDTEAFKLIPCASAAKDENATPSSACCLQVKKLGQNPGCLCAVMLSNTAKNSGVNPEIAITIPKRCNLSDRPVGYKCGAPPLSHMHIRGAFELNQLGSPKKDGDHCFGWPPPCQHWCWNLYLTLKTEDHKSHPLLDMTKKYYSFGLVMGSWSLDAARCPFSIAQGLSTTWCRGPAEAATCICTHSQLPRFLARFPQLGTAVP